MDVRGVCWVYGHLGQTLIFRGWALFKHLKLLLDLYMIRLHPSKHWEGNPSFYLSVCEPLLWSCGIFGYFEEGEAWWWSIGGVGAWRSRVFINFVRFLEYKASTLITTFARFSLGVCSGIFWCHESLWVWAALGASKTRSQPLWCSLCIKMLSWCVILDHAWVRALDVLRPYLWSIS